MAIETMRTWKIGDAMANTDVFVIGSHFSDPTAGRVVRDADGCRFEQHPGARGGA